MTWTASKRASEQASKQSAILSGLGMKITVLVAVLIAVTACGDAKKAVGEEATLQPTSSPASSTNADPPQHIEPAPTEAPTEEIGPLAPQATCPDSKDCATCVADLRTWMQALEDEGHDDVVYPPYLELDMVIVPSTVPTVALPRSLVVLVAKNSITAKGTPVANAHTIAQRPTEEWHIRELHDELARDWNSRCRQSDDFGPWKIIVQLDAQTPWRVVRDVVWTIEAAGADEILFAVHKTSLVAPPLGLKPPPDPSGKASLLMPDMHKHIEQREDALLGSCEGARKVLRRQKREDRDRLFIDLLPPAIEACDCQVDIEGLKAWRWERNDRSGMKGLHTTGLRLTFSDKEPTPIVHPSDLPWAEASKSLGAVSAAYFDIAGSPISNRPEVRPADTECSQRKAKMPERRLRENVQGGFIAKMAGEACLWPGGLRGYDEAHTNVSFSNLSVKGDLSSAALTDHLQRELRLRSCRTVKGPAKVRFTILKGGKVTSLETASPDREAPQCIESALDCVVFPLSKRGDKVDVTFDLNLEKIDSRGNSPHKTP